MRELAKKMRNQFIKDFPDAEPPTLDDMLEQVKALGLDLDEVEDKLLGAAIGYLDQEQEPKYQLVKPSYFNIVKARLKRRRP